MKKNVNIKSRLTWQPVSKKTILETVVFNVEEITSISPEMKTKSFISLNAPNWVLVIPEVLNESGEKCFLMVEQWRHGAERTFIEFPGGVIDKAESPDEAAKRELLEETGYTASKLTFLAEMYTNPAIMQNKCFLFLAEQCRLKTQKLNLDENEFLNVVVKPVKEVLPKLGIPPYDHPSMNFASLQYSRINNLQQCRVKKMSL
ncbi:MAG: DNA mismatch repair protein MutT [Treponema sp.]|nr:MAG: DNA mismatch repair protein MutT [Treponema sp.]